MRVGAEGRRIGAAVGGLALLAEFLHDEFEMVSSERLFRWRCTSAENSASAPGSKVCELLTGNPEILTPGSRSALFIP